jgi:hypothetical protein
MNRFAILAMVAFLHFLGVILGGVGITRAGTINLSTGLDASNNLLFASGQADANWTVVQTGTPAQAVLSDSPDFYGPPTFPASSYPGAWFPNGPNSNWIAYDASVAHGNGLVNGQYTTYQRTFDLSGFDLSAVSLSVAWTVDDDGTLYLNGNQLDQSIENWHNLQNVVVPAGSPDFKNGLNTLTIQTGSTINYTDNYLEGVRLEGSVSGLLPVPEPSLVSDVVGIGLIGLVWHRRRALCFASRYSPR